ncbi:hypothetical protein [Gordonia neofelifaecis]|uniref:Mce associated membrane protein n=1 Tax=Gordonia neofelifaecis NRRL B-59395 TaxID=644548 RepID=F1YNX0_9ACTN|nr:hypothetical protein [Gordonia neofelifaecis]EGD53589.1 hypothetical protein SCNU_18097 [Gordonia neofelifaecis NRRL B-59395]
MGLTRSDERLRQWRRARGELRSARDDLSAAEASAGLRATMSRRTRTILAAIATAAVVVAGVAIWYAASAPTQYSDEDYLKAATASVELLLDVDSNDPNRAKQILAGSTGSFHDAFAQSADAYSAYVKESGAHGQGAVDAAAVQYSSTDGAEVMVAASMQVTNKDSQAGTEPLQTLRLVVSVVPEDGRLKVDGLVMVP